MIIELQKLLDDYLEFRELEKLKQLQKRSIEIEDAELVEFMVRSAVSDNGVDRNVLSAWAELSDLGDGYLDKHLVDRLGVTPVARGESISSENVSVDNKESLLLHLSSSNVLYAQAGTSYTDELAKEAASLLMAKGYDKIELIKPKCLDEGEQAVFVSKLRDELIEMGFPESKLIVPELKFLEQKETEGHQNKGGGKKMEWRDFKGKGGKFKGGKFNNSNSSNQRAGYMEWDGSGNPYMNDVDRGDTYYDDPPMNYDHPSMDYNQPSMDYNQPPMNYDNSYQDSQGLSGSAPEPEPYDEFAQPSEFPDNSTYDSYSANGEADVQHEQSMSEQTLDANSPTGGEGQRHENQVERGYASDMPPMGAPDYGDMPPMGAPDYGDMPPMGEPDYGDMPPMSAPDYGDTIVPDKQVVDEPVTDDKSTDDLGFMDKMAHGVARSISEKTDAPGVQAASSTDVNFDFDDEDDLGSFTPPSRVVSKPSV